MAMTDRAGRWITEQIGRFARSVNEVALELGCDWRTVNDTLIAYGTALVDDEAGNLKRERGWCWFGYRDGREDASMSV